MVSLCVSKQWCSHVSETIIERANISGYGTAWYRNQKSWEIWSNLNSCCSEVQQHGLVVFLHVELVGPWRLAAIPENFQYHPWQLWKDDVKLKNVIMRLPLLAYECLRQLGVRIQRITISDGPCTHHKDYQWAPWSLKFAFLFVSRLFAYRDSRNVLNGCPQLLKCDPRNHQSVVEIRLWSPKWTLQTARELYFLILVR